MVNNKKRRCYITVILLAVLTVVSGCNKVNDFNKNIDENARSSASDTNVRSLLNLVLLIRQTIDVYYVCREAVLK